MSMKRRLTALTLAVLMLLPALGLGEGNYEAGAMLTTLFQDAYRYGNQINVHLTFDGEPAADTDSRRAAAACSVLNKCGVELSFYDDYGTGRICADVSLDGIDVFQATLLTLDDGSVQLTTNLTGNTVLALPAGTLGGRKFDLMDFFYGAMMRRRTDVKLSEMSARERLQATASDELVLILDHLLGWVSYTQRERDDEFYVFDKTDIEATDTRDAVSQRMIGQVYAAEFCELFWNIVSTTDAQMGSFQQAIADCLAEMGVTGLSVQQFADRLMTEETIDPMTDFVTPTHALPNDGALCTKRNVSYFFKKLVKCCEKIWDECNDEMLTLVVSYNENGRMVGFDAVLPKFTENLPYEGSFTWSLKTDEYGQERFVTHGELQVFGEQRIVGDATLLKGRDVSGVCESGFDVSLDLMDTKGGHSAGIGAAGSLVAVTSVSEDGSDRETLTADARLESRTDGEPETVMTADLTGETETPDGTTMNSGLTAAFSFVSLMDVTAKAVIETGAADEIAATGGQAVLVTELDEAEISRLSETVKSKVVGMVPLFMLHPGLLSDLAKLVSP